MTRFDAHWTRWPLRIAFVLVAAEATLRLSTGLLDRAVMWRRAVDTKATIFCGGDSNTQGVGATEGHSYPAQLQRILNEHHCDDQVANLGVAGSKSEQAVQRLARALADGAPRVVIFLAGINDQAHTDQFVAAAPARSPSLRDEFMDLRIVRVARAAYFLAIGDLVHREVGGADESRFSPERKQPADFARCYEEALGVGGQAQFDWVSFFWHSENRVWLRRAWHDFTASPAFTQVESQLQLPRACYEWEVALLSGEEPAAIAAEMPRGTASNFARYTQLRAALATGDRRAAVEQLNGLAQQSKDQNFGDFLSLHAAWALLLDRDFGAADEALRRIAGKFEARSLINSGGEYDGSLQGLYHALGGAAVAHLLTRPDARLSEVTGPSRKAWDRLLWRTSCPDGLEWLDAAMILDAARDGTPDGLKKAQRKARARYLDGPRTRVLTCLLRQPLPPFEELAATIELDLPRLSWIGPQRLFFRPLPADVLDSRLATSLDRLGELSRKQGFKVVVLTYLAPVQHNRRLLRLARERGFITVDFHAIYTDSVLLAEDRRRNFSGDRSHPNDAGYALVASAIYDTLVAEGLCSSAPDVGPAEAATSGPNEIPSANR